MNIPDFFSSLNNTKQIIFFQKTDKGLHTLIQVYLANYDRK